MTLRDLRKGLGRTGPPYTLLELAKHVGCTSPHLSNVERGRHAASPKLLYRLAMLYGLDYPLLVQAAAESHRLVHALERRTGDDRRTGARRQSRKGKPDRAPSPEWRHIHGPTGK